MSELSFGKKFVFCFITIVLINPVFNSCSSQDALRKKTVNTRKTISTGLQRGNIIYFLCDYVLSKSGTTIIPMYIHTPGTVYFDKVFLYSLNIPKEKLTQIADLKPTFSHSGRGMVDYAKWAYSDSKIYVLYSTGWDKATKKYIYDVFSYDIKNNTANEITNDDKKKILDKYFSSGKPKNVISMTRVMYYAGCVPEEEWQLPSPIEYSSAGRKELKRFLIEQVGDPAFKDAVFQIIRKSITEEEANKIIASMKKWNEELPRDKQMIYTPYLEKWSAKLSMAARLNSKQTQPDESNSNNIDLLEAAFTDNVKKLTALLKTIDINTADENGCTALMYAIFGKAPHTMEVLIRKGADLKRETKSGYIAWMFVSNTGLRRRFIGLTGM